MHSGIGQQCHQVDLLQNSICSIMLQSPLMLQRLATRVQSTQQLLTAVLQQHIWNVPGPLSRAPAPPATTESLAATAVSSTHCGIVRVAIDDMDNDANDVLNGFTSMAKNMCHLKPTLSSCSDLGLDKCVEIM